MTDAVVPLDQLIENPRNPRQHPHEQIEGLAASIRHFGQPKPVLARKANNMLIAGHGVWQAMAKAGLTEIKVMFWDLPQADADAFMLADNRHPEAGHTDAAKAANLLREIEEELWGAIGYSHEEAVKDLGRLELGRIEVITVDVSDVNDQFWIVCRGPLEQQALALQQLQTVMAKLPGVEVELGTETHA